MARDLAIPIARAGQPISAGGWNAIRLGVMQHQAPQFGFSSNLGLLTRPQVAIATSLPAIYGLLDESIAAGGYTPDCIEAYVRAEDGTFIALLDEDDNPVRYGAQNMNSYTDINIYLDPDSTPDPGEPIRVFVWGFPFEFDFGTEEESDVQTCMEIWNPPPEPALMEGFVKKPANDRGQGYVHRNDSNKGVLDGTACGDS